MTTDRTETGAAMLDRLSWYFVLAADAAAVGCVVWIIGVVVTGSVSW